MLMFLFSGFHKENLHKVIKIAVEDALCVGGFVTGAKVLDHLVWMKNVAADLRAPLDLLLLALKLCLFLLTFLELYVVETRLEDSQCILPVVQLRTGLGILDNDS